MTREEVIGYLKCADTTVGKKIKTKTAEAIEMAIKALEQDPYGDYISRQAAKDKYEECLVNNLKDNDRGIDLSKYAEKPYKAFCEFMDSIPPVTPQPKKKSKNMSIEVVKSEETKESEIKYLNINIAEEEIDRNPDIVRLCDADKDKYMEFVNVKVLEDIKAEIESRCAITVNSNNEPAMTLHDIFSIIDSYISGKEK